MADNTATWLADSVVESLTQDAPPPAEDPWSIAGIDEARVNHLVTDLAFLHMRALVRDLRAITRILQNDPGSLDHLG